MMVRCIPRRQRQQEGVVRSGYHASSMLHKGTEVLKNRALDDRFVSSLYREHVRWERVQRHLC